MLKNEEIANTIDDVVDYLERYGHNQTGTYYDDTAVFNKDRVCVNTPAACVIGAIARVTNRSVFDIITTYNDPITSTGSSTHI